jgi:hypothetical protein
MIENIVQNIFLFFLSFIFFILRLLFMPLDILISTLLPRTTTAFQAIADIFSLIGDSIAWAFSLTGLSNSIILLIIAYYTFKLTVPFQLWLFKMAVQWWGALKR